MVRKGEKSKENNFFPFFPFFARTRIGEVRLLVVDDVRLEHLLVLVVEVGERRHLLVGHADLLAQARRQQVLHQVAPNEARAAQNQNV